MTTNLSSLSFPEDYFCDEVRDGFFVSETMKRHWAACLKVLSEIDKICSRHNLNWYSDSGTMIGAIRHKGFIPWDDDIDISMLRKDYEDFLEYAIKELPQEYCILCEDVYVDDNERFQHFSEPFCVITNGHVITNSSDYLEQNFGYPLIASIDIFPLDNIYNDSAKERNRRNRGDYVYQTIQKIVKNSISDNELKQRVRKIEEENNVIIKNQDIHTALVRIFSQISQENKDNDSEEVAIMSFWIPKGKCLYSRSWYDEWIDMPFETTMLRIPTQYHTILSSYYGDYMTPVKGTAEHDYPTYRNAERVFKDYSNKYPFRFCFHKEDFSPATSKRTLREKHRALLTLMHNMHGYIQNNNRIELLQKCQDAAITIGNSIENKFGEGTELVSCLEQYCEKVYGATNSWNNDVRNELDGLIAKIEKLLDELFNTKQKDILFLLCKATWWDSIEEVFLTAKADSQNNVNVITIPYYYHDHKGIIGKMKNDLKSFQMIPELNCNITSFGEYDIEKKHPDTIVIQFPYDGYSGTIGIPELLYSSNLSQYTDMLIYVPFLNPDPPTSVEDISFKAMTDLVEQPAVFNADKVIVSSNELRDYYIKRLVEMTDNKMQNYWEERISTHL
ncbi:LicD family protein [Butyrivibrio fibrisolvens]|uniref:LicD family protein n=1 Tax=Butyrivibrio fibrisolvens TaxID=831 RepID=UPI000422791B|nr:LicD family protein [Butyrivibrio fibrisolvens]